MNYDFSSLSHGDFENLARDLVGCEIGKRFEAFPEGPDDGMDGRHALAEGSIILQAKHYHRSGFSSLKSKMTKERRSIDQLQPKRYILATSASLTPGNKSALAEIIGPSLQNSGDIFGPDEGYRVFADILTLQPGDRWRREINIALQYRAAKVLLLCRNATLADQNVQDDLDIALDVSRELNDSRFIIPLRLEAGRKVKGIGDAVTVDFVRGWGEGLGSLLDALQRQKVPQNPDQIAINPNWDIFRRRGAIPLIDEPERLTSN